MGALTAVVRELGDAAEDITLRRPTLDEVFLRLTEERGMSLRWAIADTWTLTLRALAHWARQPFVLLVGLLFPILMLLMFAYLLRGAYGAAITPELLVPGMLALTTRLRPGGDDDRDRHRRRTAGSPTASGRCRWRRRRWSRGAGVADLLNAAVGLAVLMACGLAIGWSWHDGAPNALAAVALLLWLRFALIWLGLYLGLVAGKPEAVVAVQILVWPLGFLSNAFAIPATMPGWLGTIAEWNPLSATVAATRELFGNPGWGGDSWPATHSL